MDLGKRIVERRIYADALVIEIRSISYK